MLYCINCGYELPEEAKFCSNCGREVQDDTDGDEEQSQCTTGITSDSILSNHVLTNLCQKIYGKGFIEYELLEQELGQLKKGGFLQYQHLEMIREHWPLFDKWYAWPQKEKLQEELFEAKISFEQLDVYDGGDPHFRIERNLFSRLNKIFKHSELVSIILRFVDPDHFGIYSPPVVYYLGVARGVNYEEDYINYLKQLREFQQLFEQDKAAYTDMTIWVLTKSTQYRQLLEEDGDSEIYKSQVDWVKQSEAADRILPDVFRNKTYFELAEIFYRYSYYDLAAVNAGKAFEEAVIKKCMKAGIPIRNNYDNSFRPLIDLVKDLSFKMHWKDSALHKARKIRNNAAHPSSRPLKKEEVKLLLDVICRYFLGLNNVVRIQGTGDKSKGEMIVTYREFTDWLNLHYKAETKCPTLGGQSSFLFRYDKSEKVAYIKRSTGKEGILEESQMQRVFHRYVTASDEERNQTGYYTDPKWRDTPDRILAPYIASLLRFWWRDTVK